MSYQIPFVDLRSVSKNRVLDEIFSGIRRIYDRSQFILGEEVQEFEKRYSRVAGCQYGIGLNSCTDGLFLCLRALGIGSGDEVITAPNSFVATAAAIALVGAKPVFVDVSDDHNINPDLIEKSITPKTKAIIPVHLTGNPCKMEPIMTIAKKHGLRVIEDAAQAVGATYDGKPVGSFGDAACFSLHPLKNLHVWGDGGMVTTNSETLASALKLQRNHGLKNRDEVEFFSYNSRLDTVQAVVGLAFLKLLEETTQKRIHNSQIYYQRLARISDFVQTPIVDRSKTFPVFHVYVITAKNRDGLVEHLKSKGIETKIHYPIPIHLQKASAYLGYKQGDFPVCEKLSSSMVSIPIRENLTDEQVNYVCDSIESFYR